jgi:hypothetical protein
MNDELQFDRVQAAEGAAPAVAGPLTCRACQQPIADQYYDLNGAVACDNCRGQILGHLQSPLGSRRFWRAFWFGSGAAVLSAILWYAVGAITGYSIGLVAVAVGYIVGKAVNRGAEARGGRKVQVLAVLLAYGAMSMANIPAVFSALAKMSEEHKQEDKAKNDKANGDEKPSAGKLAVSLVVLVLVVIALACAAPFLGSSSWFSLVFIAIALWEAWKLNRAPMMKVSGPFRVGEGTVAA